MGTRGTYGFRKGGVDKLAYNHFDSYPSGLGAGIVKFCENTSIEQMNEIFDKIIMVDEGIKPTEDQIKEVEKYNGHLLGHSDDEWYNLLRNTQGELDFYKGDLRYMINANGFIENSLFCEHGYIINLDTNELEYWVGFQQSPQAGNRYGETKADSEEYYPCKLKNTFSLSKLSEDVISIMEQDEEDTCVEEDCGVDLEYIADMVRDGFTSGDCNGHWWSIEID